MPADDYLYDPFSRGPYPVGVRTLQARDPRRDRVFPVELWYPAAAQHIGQDLDPATRDAFVEPGAAPRHQSAIRAAAAQPGRYPLVLFSHSSGGDRRQSSFLCTHLASHGYLVAALDHSERVTPELLRREGENPEQFAARIQGWISNRVPDISFLLDRLLEGEVWDTAVAVDPTRVGIVGHSFGGWTALAAPEVVRGIRAVVALAPGGSSNPPPNIIPATLTFDWGRDVPTLYLVAEDDRALPLAGMFELFERTRSTKRMLILRRADHMHFADDFEPGPGQHGTAEAHLFVRALTLAHFDAFLRDHEAARRFWTGDLERLLADRGIDMTVSAP